MQEKGIISTNQYIWLIFSVITSFTTLQIPGMLIAHSRKEAWLAVLGAWFFDVLVALLYAYLAVRFPGEDIIQYSMTICGKYVGRIVGLIFTLFFMIVAIGLIHDLCILIGNLFFPKTPINVLIVTSFILIAYGSKKGLEVLARTSEILGPIYLLSFIVLFAIALPTTKFNDLSPQLYNGMFPFLTGIPFLLSFIGICIIMGMFIPYCNKPANGFIAKFFAASLGSLMIGLLVVFCICTFGSEQAGNMINPGLQLSRLVSVGKVFQRLEAIWLMISIAAALMTSMSLIWAFSLGVSQIVGMKSYKPIVYPSALIALISCITFFEDSVDVLNFTNYSYPFIALFVEIVLGTVLLVAAVIMKKRGKSA